MYVVSKIQGGGVKLLKMPKNTKQVFSHKIMQTANKKLLVFHIVISNFPSPNLSINCFLITSEMKILSVSCLLLMKLNYLDLLGCCFLHSLSTLSIVLDKTHYFPMQHFFLNSQFLHYIILPHFHTELVPLSIHLFRSEIHQKYQIIRIPYVIGLTQ